MHFLCQLVIYVYYFCLNRELFCKLTNKWTTLKTSLKVFNARLTSLNQKLDDTYNELKNQIDNKAYVNDVVEVSERLEILEAKARD